MEWIRAGILIPIGVISFHAPVIEQTRAQPLPRACMTWQRDPGGPLPRRDVDNVLYRSLPFRRASQNYEAETFSDMARAGDDRCFRWEMVNNSKPDGGGSDPNRTAIDELNWPAASIRVQHMLAGDDRREHNNIRDRIEAKNGSNPVYAFENEQQVTQSWQTKEQTAAESTPPPQSSGQQSNGQESSSNTLPSQSNGQAASSREKNPKFETKPADQVRAKMGIKIDLNPNVPITVISFPEGYEKPLQIDQEVGFGRVLIRVQSEVIPSKDQVRLFTKAYVEKLPEEVAQAAPRFVFPGMIALKRIEPKTLGDREDAAKFVNYFHEAQVPSEPPLYSWDLNLTVARTSDGSLSIYRVLQPIAVFASGSSHCYLVATYSPIPIGFTLRDCWKP
jgi:hypothetical protein